MRMIRKQLYRARIHLGMYADSINKGDFHQARPHCWLAIANVVVVDFGGSVGSSGGGICDG